MSTQTGIIISNSADGAGQELKPEEWHLMNLSQLWAQHSVLNRRLAVAQELRHEALTKGMQSGIDVLNELIKIKSSDSDGIHLM